MNDRFKYRLVFKKTYRTINGNFDGYEIYYCNGFIKTKNKIEFKSKNKRYNFYSCSLKSIDQCTGLKDKNGKLIYEGDIVRFKDNVTIKGSKTHISTVEHNEAFNAFMYHAECMGLYTVNKAQNEQFDVEVIGNIYENKELLESEG